MGCTKMVVEQNSSNEIVATFDSCSQSGIAVNVNLELEVSPNIALQHQT